MTDNRTVRLGIIGVGGMGSCHASLIQEHKVPRCELTAVCDADPRKLEGWDGIRTFADSAELIRSGEVDAVLIATPHYDHTAIGIDALEQGLHVLMEKPISVHKKDCEKLIAAHTNKDLVFGAMFQMRTDPHYRRIKKLVDEGELGELQRTNWIITSWYRTEAYYASGGWRATWKGEGGGVLLNQCPHTLDLFQWICGMPVRVRAFGALGKYHAIEVEDEITAYLEYANGATGVFVTSTGEAPGTDRLEIAGDRGKVVVEDGKITFVRNEVPASEHCKTSEQFFSMPEHTSVEIAVEGTGEGHVGIHRNFVNAVLDGEPLIAPAEEGIHSVELGNAMLYSSLIGETVALPLDGDAYEKKLKELIADSKFKKHVVEKTGEGMDASFH